MSEALAYLIAVTGNLGFLAPVLAQAVAGGAGLH